MNKSRKINIKIHIISWDSALKYFTQFILQVRPTNQNGGDRQRSTSLYNDPPTRLHRLDAREANSNFVVRNALWEVARTNNVNILYYLLAPANRYILHYLIWAQGFLELTFRMYTKPAFISVFSGFLSSQNSPRIKFWTLQTQRLLFVWENS